MNYVTCAYLIVAPLELQQLLLGGECQVHQVTRQVQLFIDRVNINILKFYKVREGGRKGECKERSFGIWIKDHSVLVVVFRLTSHHLVLMIW